MLEFISIKGVFLGLFFWFVFLLIGTSNAIRSQIQKTQVGLKFSSHAIGGGFVFVLITALFSYFAFGILLLLISIIFTLINSELDKAKTSKEPDLATLEPTKGLEKYPRKKVSP